MNPANSHKYFLLEPAAWTNAEATAVAMGGHLVTINDDAENSWINSTFGRYGGVERDLWIGFYDPDPSMNSTDPIKRQAEYAWISGQPVTVQLWSFPGLWDTNHVIWGYCKLCKPNDLPSRAGLWADESASTLLNSVIELPRALEIVSQPKSITVGIGCDASFSVIADGVFPIYYQWRSGETILPGETNRILTITNVQTFQSGTFSVVISNSSGTAVSSPAYLGVAGIVSWGSTSFLDTRTNVPADLTNVVAIAAGDRHDLALKADGTVVSWGENDYNQLAVPAGLSNVVAVAGALYHSLALKADGRVVSWGYDVQTGNWVPGDLSNVVAIAAGGYHNLALKSDGTVAAWGGGDGARPTVAPPARLTNVVAITTGGGTDFALKADGTVVAWDDMTAQLIDVPTDLTNIVAIAAGMAHTLALRADGTVVAWGMDWQGQADVPAGLTNVVAIAAGTDHSLALKADGSVVAWGDNWAGQSSVPPSLPNVIAIAAGYRHSVALLRDGAPSMTVQPWDRAVALGSAAHLEAKAVGMQSMKYQWQFNGNDIPGAIFDTYSITNVKSADAGFYSLKVSNPIGNIASRLAKLVVSGQPVRLTPLALTNGTFQFRINGPIGPAYVIQASEGLANWVNLQTSSPAFMPFDFAETNVAVSGNRFYRVRLGP